MIRRSTRIVFSRAVDHDEILGTLNLALIAATILHGEDRVRLHAPNTIQGHIVEIDTAHEVGQSLALMFVGYCRREYPPTSFNVEQVTSLLPSADETRRS